MPRNPIYRYEAALVERNDAGSETAVDVVPLRTNVCPECPWRTDKRGLYAPQSPDRIKRVIEAGVGLSCHMTQRQSEMNLEQQGLRRCLGLEHFRANVGLPSLASPDEVAHASWEDAERVWRGFWGDLVPPVE